MKYYKMIKDQAIIGVISSSDFISFEPLLNGYVSSNEDKGELVGYKGQLYRSTWMRPLQEFTHTYILVDMINITEEEYNIYYEAIENNEEIDDTPDEDIPEEPIPVDPIEQNSLDFIRTSKINAMSYACKMAIEAGFNLQLRGEIHHFSLTTQDQLNLMSLSALAQTQELIPYHADGEEVTFYTAEEINTIITAATNHKIYQTTYYNALKTYINTLETIEEISTIQYGIAIPDEYKSDVLNILEQ